MKLDKEERKFHKNSLKLFLRKGLGNFFNSYVDVNNELEYIKEIINKYNPEILLVSFFLKQSKKGTKSNEVFTHAYEMLHGFLLIYGKGELKEITLSNLKRQIPTRGEMKKFTSCLELFFTSFYVNEHYKYFMKSPNLLEITKDPESVLRFRTNVVRRIGNGRQHIDYIKEIAGNLDDSFKVNHGFLLTDFVEGFITLIGNKSNEIDKEKSLYQKCKKTLFSIEKYFGLKLKDYNSLTIARLLLFPPKVIIKFFSLNIVLENYMLYTLEDLCGVFNVEYSNKSELLKLMKKISVQFGELNQLKDTDLYLENPIWTRPFIRIHDELYMYPNPEIPLTSIEEIIISILEPKEKRLFNDYKTKKFLEQKIYKLLEEKFGNQDLYLGTKWTSKSSNQQFENDILLIYGENAIVIEIKGNNLTDQGRKGLPNRTNKKIGEIIEKAAQQSNQFIEHLSEFKGKKVKLKSSNGKNFIVDLTDVTNFISLGISFEWMIFMSLGLRELRKDFNIPIGHIHMSLIELSMILDILENPNDIIYYLLQRSKLETVDIFIKGDENDLIIHYLEEKFNFSRFTVGYNSYDITGRFFELSNPSYFELKYPLLNEKNSSKEALEKFKEYKQKVKKPIIKRTNFWNIIIDQLNKKSILKYQLNVFGTILGVNYKDQILIERELYKRVKYYKKEPFFVVTNDFLTPNLYVYLVRSKQNKNLMEIIYKDKSFDDFIIKNNFGIILVFTILNDEPKLVGLSLPAKDVVEKIFNKQRQNIM